MLGNETTHNLLYGNVNFKEFCNVKSILLYIHMIKHFLIIKYIKTNEFGDYVVSHDANDQLSWIHKFCPDYLAMNFFVAFNTK
jgi:hypothetical protein